MKKYFIKLFLFTAFITSFSISNAQFWQPTFFPIGGFNGGFGTAGPLPTTLLRVNEGSVLFDGINGTTPVFGGGRRLMWIPELGAFRAGGVGATQWDIIGTNSFAGGFNTRAEGANSTAFGGASWALGIGSFAAGTNSQATADYTTALGEQAIASNQRSTAIGYTTTASGSESFSIGSNLSATNLNAFALGHDNLSSGQGAMTFGAFATATADHAMAIGASKATTPFTNSNPFSLKVCFESDSPTLYVGPGNGTGTFGNVGIGTSSPQAPLHVLAHSSDAAIFIPDGIAGSNPLVRISDPFGFPGMTILRNGNRADVRYSGAGLEFVAGTGTGARVVALRLVNNTNQLELNNGNYVDVDLAGGGTTGASINNNGELIRTPSDARLKENVTELNDNLAKIKLLRPVSYNYIDRQRFGDGRTIGFIAQEVEQVIPEVVKKAADDYQLRSLNYVEIIPVLTGALQEQTKIIEDQKTLINGLLKRVETLEATVTKNDGQKLSANTDGAYLKQNVPNPSAQSTVIKFYLPATVATASLTIYDMTGKQLKAIPVSVRGEETGITINAGELTAGMYMYALIADGKEIDTKKMIISQ